VPPIPGVYANGLNANSNEDNNDKQSRILSANVSFGVNAFADESKLSKDVAVVGGGDVGAEIGIFLARAGHNVTIVEMRNMLAADAPPIFYRSVIQDICAKQERLNIVLNAKCTKIESDGVTIAKTDGSQPAEQKILAGSIVLSAGMKSKLDDALKFYGSAQIFELIGDCETAGNVQKAVRSAFAAAVRL